MKLKQRREPDSTLRRGIVWEGKYICVNRLWSVEDESREELVELDFKPIESVQRKQNWALQWLFNQDQSTRRQYSH